MNRKTKILVYCIWICYAGFLAALAIINWKNDGDPIHGASIVLSIALFIYHYHALVEIYKADITNAPEALRGFIQKE